MALAMSAGTEYGGGLGTATALVFRAGAAGARRVARGLGFGLRLGFGLEASAEFGDEGAGFLAGFLGALEFALDERFVAEEFGEDLGAGGIALHGAAENDAFADFFDEGFGIGILEFVEDGELRNEASISWWSWQR